MTTLQPSTVVADRFEILQALAPAGAGRLYRAKDRNHADRTITLEVIDHAVTAMDPKAVEAFVKDASTAAEVPHEGIAKVLEAGADSTAGLLWVAMEPLDGETLRDRLNRGPISPREALGIVQRVLDVLAAAHARSAVHRGLTPEDIVLVRRADGTDGVELLDFGFARHLAAPPSSPYISPEQARASSWVTPAADVFSLGAIFYEMVTGRAPHDPPQPVRELAPSTPPPIATLIEKCLKSDPADRPSDAGAVKTQLQNILSPPPPPPPAQPYGPPPGMRPPGVTPFGPPPGGPPGAYAPYAPVAAGTGGPVMSGPAPEPRKSGGWGWIIALIALAGVCLIAPIVLVFVGMFAAMNEVRNAPYDPYAHPSPTPTPYDPTQPTGPGPFLPDPLPAPSAVERYNVPVTPAQPQRGPSDALVTIVMFSDFECPFCARVEETMTRIVATYPRDVRIVWRNNPLAFHPNAEPAAQLAMEAHAQGGNDAFWRVHDLLFANNRSLGREDLLRYATQAGLDRGRARAAIDDHAHTLGIASDQALAAQLGADGTPSFFINGRPLVGAQPFESFQAIIDEEIRTANERIATGVPREQIYDTLVRDAPTAEASDPLGGLGIQGGGLGLDDGGEEPGAGADPVYALAVPRDAPARGRSGAAVTIQLVSDFQCPFCNRVRPTVDRILREHRNVRLVWRDYPLSFHQDAMPAAEAAREALAQGGDRKFWQMHDLLFDNQHALSRPDLERYAQQVGLDMTRFRRALDQHTHEAAIRADMAAIEATGADLGTPSFFINGRLLQGAQPYESFDQAIQQAMLR